MLQLLLLKMLLTELPAFARTGWEKSAGENANSLPGGLCLTLTAKRHMVPPAIIPERGRNSRVESSTGGGASFRLTERKLPP
jgi:hypothetical protein